MIKKIITGLKAEKEKMKNRFATIGNENLDDILQDLCVEIIIANKTFLTPQEALYYWKRAFVNKCCDYIDQRKKRRKASAKSSAKRQSHWRNPRYKHCRLTFACFTINDLMTRLTRRGMMTTEIYYCILCDAHGVPRSQVSKNNAISRDKLNRLIKEGRRQLEGSLLTFYLIDDQSHLRHRL